MTEMSSADFCKLTIQEVADLLMESIEDKECSAAKCYGVGDDGRKYSLKVVMELCDDDED